MSNEYTLEVTSRDSGKSASRQLRRDQYAPGIVYSGKVENQLLALEQKYVDKYKKILNDNPIFVFKSDDKKLDGQRAIIKDIVFHPVNRKAVHVDFYAIAKGEKITVTVKIELTGTPQGVKDGGVLSVPHHEIEVECLPKDLPSKIEHDVSEMELDSNLHVKDLKMPAGVVAVTAENVTLATVAKVKEQSEETAPAQAASETEAPAAGPAEGENKE